MVTPIAPIGHTSSPVSPIPASGGRTQPRHATPLDLTFEQRGRLRDILVPVIREDGEVATSFDTHQLIGYTGGHRVHKVYNDDQKLRIWAMGLVAKCTEQLDATAPGWDKEEDLLDDAFNFRVVTDVGSFRCHMDRTVVGRQLFMRRLPDVMPKLSQIAMPNSFASILMSHRLISGGLVLCTGGNGQGKTTVASVTVTARLEEHGGYAVTIENPAELPMHGFHGAGYCVQTELTASDNARQNEAFTDAMARARRKFPALTGGGTQLYIGEIRSAAVAAEVLLAAFEGHLVVATLHGASIQDSIARLIGMAGSVNGFGYDQATNLARSVLRVVTEQQLNTSNSESDDWWEQGAIDGRILWLPHDAEANKRNLIVDANAMPRITAVVDAQQRAFEPLSTEGEYHRAAVAAIEKAT